VPRRRELALLAALTALGAALRFWHLGSQSFWFDESYTVDLVHRGLGDMLSTIPHTESTPPLYYLLAWTWAKLFGTSEAGLRSLSALIGTATVPLAWSAAKALFRDRAQAGLIDAALTAVNPWFVWYSQEARSYTLLVFTVALTLVFLARRRTIAWAIAAVLALLTHYFAGFIVLAEAAWLLYMTRERTARYAIGLIALAGAALIPLALHQRATQNTSFIAQLSLERRIVDLPKKLVTGELGTFTPLIGPLAGAVALAAIAYALYRERRPTLGLLWIVAIGAGVPILAALAGADYLLPRNVIGVYVPLVLAVAGGLAAARPALGLAGAAILCAVAIAVNVQVTRDDRLQRTDWRDAANALRGPGPQAIVVTPEWDAKPLRLYSGDLPALPPQGARVNQLVAIGEGQPPNFATPPPPPGFRLAQYRRTASYLLIRYVSASPRPVTPATMAAVRLGSKPPAFLERK
jgi:uncharacterized membrane protein